VLAEELTRAQPFEVDLDVEVDLGPAGRSDDLALTLDYGGLVGLVQSVLGGESCGLLEALAERIAAAVGDDDRVLSVTVAVRKLRPPVPADMSSAGVRITRSGGAARTGRRRAFLGLGSNLGDRLAHLRGAVFALPDVVAVSPVYETEPVGTDPGQPPYLNAVVELHTHLSARDLLGLAGRLEAAAGRQRSPGANPAPRTLDVDVLMVGEHSVDEADLVVPHPRMRRRRFVMAPLADIAPDVAGSNWEDHAAGQVRRFGRI